MTIHSSKTLNKIFRLISENIISFLKKKIILIIINHFVNKINN